ncbi:MAG: hypothetical protein EHM61_08075 [Acidobacteria bacterium]|nr:MAG: hypothetical protein EHM61_08075 [Acidobacteriota bacterium]
MRNQLSFPVPATNYPPATRARVIVWGMLAAFPFGGMTWQALHYVAGLRRLGFDAWYVEDSDGEMLDPLTLWNTSDYSANVRYLSTWMALIGLGNRWVFRPPGHPEICMGARDCAGLELLYREADLVMNLCGYHSVGPRHPDLRCLAYVQTDPMADQVKVAKGESKILSQLDTYDHLFTYAENIGADDCLVPMERYRWHPTRPPVCLDWWAMDRGPSPGAALTSISNWSHWNNTVEWQGQRYYWRKDREFRRFIHLPEKSPVPLELALDGIGDLETEEMRNQGWRIVPARDLSDPLAYLRYISASLGEFSVAKDQYVRPRTGWFSDRSVCYLAAGRPVIAQETCFSRFIPTGRGLFAFQTQEEILAAIDAVQTDPEANCRAAREIAAEYFAAETVIGSFMQRIGF